MIQSLERAVVILKLVAESDGGIRLCDLSRASDLNRNTVFNLANTLVKEKLLGKTPEGKYVIGDLTHELAEGQKRGDCLRSVEKTLQALHLKHPGANIYYSELGRSDIFTRIHFFQNNPGKAKYLDSDTLNPYITVSGLIFSAFAPDDKLIELRIKNPFEYFGLNAWGSLEKFRGQVELTRKKGYAETPSLVSASDLKIGIPVWKRAGDLQGAVTFHLREVENTLRQGILTDIMSFISKKKEK